MPCGTLLWQIQEANIAKETKQFTYKDGSQFVFMDLVQICIPSHLQLWHKWIIE